MTFSPQDISSFLILVVDDNAPGRYVKSRLLRGNGYRTIEAANGREALEMVDRHAPDLLVLDVRLPDIDGIKVCAAVKGDPATRTTLVLQTSALANSTRERVRALENGAEAFLVEPTAPDELLASVNSLLRVRAAERELEEARRVADEARRVAEDANRAKSHFLASASHDLRQPLHTQRLLLSLLAQQLTTPQQNELAQRLSESLDASESLLKALMDLSALESSQIQPEPQIVALSGILERIASEHRAEAEAKGLEIRTHLRPASVETDPVLFERMVRNLVSNAIRYTQTGGLLLACRWRGGRWLVEVWDTGVGIPKGEISSIFQDFYQVENAERNRAKGLGLGLGVVAKMARLLNHEVSVRSRVGRGSVFAVVLKPLALCAPTPVAELLPSAPPATTGRAVLLIEDDELQRSALTLLLEGHGYIVTSADDGPAAHAVIAQGLRPDAIVTDYRLPHGSGLDCVRELRAVLGHNVPALLQTGDTDFALRDAAMEAGVDVIYKPYTMDNLTLRVGHLLSGTVA